MYKYIGYVGPVNLPLRRRGEVSRNIADAEESTRMLPTVDFCGLEVTRLVIGANPFGGFSHQNKHRDREMLSYSTVERIKETWARAEAAGINTMVTNNTSSHVVQAVDEYLRERGGLQWIAKKRSYRSCRPAWVIVHMPGENH